MVVVMVAVRLYESFRLRLHFFFFCPKRRLLCNVGLLVGLVTVTLPVVFYQVRLQFV